MNIVRKIHDQFRVKTIAGAQLETPSAVSDSGRSGGTYITIAGGSLNGSSLSEEDRNKLNSIEQGAQVNQDAFTKISLEATSVKQEEQATTTSSIIANIPSDTANIKLIGNYPISLNLESVSLFNYNTVTTAGNIVAEYNIYYDEEGNIVLQYSSGSIFNTNDIELIRIQHRDEILAQYDKTQFTYLESDGTITKFVIPYQNTNFSSIVFCKYQTTSEETEEGTQTERELVIQAELSVSPTKQSIITISSDSEQSYWNYEEDENGNKYLWTDCNVYSTKEVTAYGKSAENNSTGVSNLHELQDILLTNLSNNDLLIYDSSKSKWVNISKDDLSISADQLHNLTISVNNVIQTTYNPAQANASINISTLTLDDVSDYIDQKLNSTGFLKWFTINYDSDNNIVSIQANYDFYSVGAISAYGLNTEQGNPSYISSLGELSDVLLTNVALNNMLVYDGSNWVNIPMSSIVVDAYTKSEIDTKIDSINTILDNKLDKNDFFTLFTIIRDTNNNVVSIQANYDFYSIKGISAYGLGEGEGEPSYVSSLGELNDVTLTDVALNNILLYDGNKWVNKPMSSIAVDSYTKLEIDTKLNPISSDISTLKSNVTSIQSNLATIQNSVSDITSDISTINTTISDIQTTLTSKLDKDDFFTWFTIIKNTSGEVVSIQANFDFYSIGEVSAYGLGDIGGSGRTTLATLDDVSLSNLVVNDMLTYNGSEWVNIPMSQVRGVTSWSDLENKPTTLAQLGITDVYTKTEVNTKVTEISSRVDSLQTSKADSSIQIIAGHGLAGGGNLQQDVTLSLEELNNSGTYYKVITDSYGRVTAGATELTIDDIVNLQNELDSKLNISDFNVWFTINYNEDGTVKNICANYDLYSLGEITAYNINDEDRKTYTTLSELDDVQFNGLVINDVLVYNGTKWVNVPQSEIKGAQNWSDLQNKPTTLSGFGIVDAYTKTEVDALVLQVSNKLDDFLIGSDTDDIINKWKELEQFLAGYTETQTLAELLSIKANSSITITAGDGLTGGGNLQQDITIALQNLNSTGTYYKVNVDTYGRITSGISQLIIADIQNLQDQLDSKLNISDFNTWFTIIYNTDGTVKNIRANYDFYSVGEVSAHGVGDEEKKTYTTLAELNDVQLTNVKETDVLVYNGTKWVNVDQSTIKGAQSWEDIQNKPTTISGFGIVDVYTNVEIDNKLSPINSSITDINSSIDTINANVSDLSSSLSSVSTKLNDFLEGSDTDTIINKWKELESFLAGYTQTQTLADLLSAKADSSIQIIAGTGLVGGGDLTANRTISLSTSGVSAGAYTKVTVDTYGRVTSGSTLSATDIPDLDWSKITTGKPTTLEGYGITDGVNSIKIEGDGNAVTEATVNNHILTLTKGATYLLKSTFDDMFEKVNIGTDSDPRYVIKAKYGFYSVGEITAYGLNDNGKTTYTTLAELDDVQISNLAIDNLLKYDGSKWVNIPMSQMVVDAYTKSEMDNKLATINNIVEDVQRQTNRQVTFWFFDYDPTTTNYPASEWVTTEQKLKHEEDMFYNSISGHVWRWKLNDSSQYEWSLITDADTLRALELVEIAQNTANSKRRNFTTTPTISDTYDVGDLWSNATYGSIYDNDLLVCTTAKYAGIDFSISHWQPVGKVTSSYVSGQIYIINNSIDELDAKVKTAETNVSTAQSTANDAKTAASNAQSAADAAQSTADDAQSAADIAQSTANTAKTNAATAQDAADAAQSTANSAQSTANSALTKANANESTLTIITSGAPSDLNTLKKLAAAINNDANYYSTVNNKIALEVSTLNSRIDSEVNTLNSKISDEVKKLQDQLNTIFSWFAFENNCIKAKHSLFSVGEITAQKTS